MKRIGFSSLLSFFLIVSAIQIIPCFKAAAVHSCCQKNTQANLANPYTTCCPQQRDAAVTATFNKNASCDSLFLATSAIITDFIALKSEQILHPLRFHWPGQSKTPAYLNHLVLLL